MAGTLNKVMLIGHTGDDVKITYFEGGGSVGRFPLATNEDYVNRATGERVSNTEWHNIVVRNKAAEICEKYLKKGDKVYIEGRIKTRKWQDDKGIDRYSTEIQCSEFTFLNPKNEVARNNTSLGNPLNSNTPSQKTNPSSLTNIDPLSNSAETSEKEDLPF